MAEINLTINGRSYGIACDDGQEKRVIELGRYVDDRLREIGRSGAASNDSHLLVLTALIMADELMDLKDRAANGKDGVGASVESPLGALQITEEDEAALVEAIDLMAARIDSIAGSIGKL